MKTLKKALTVLLFFIFLFCVLNANSQTINYTWDNQSGCDWTIMLYNNATPQVAYIASGTAAPAFSGVGTVPALGCLSIPFSSPSKFEFIDPNCGCVITVTLPTGGTTVTGIVSNCAAQGCSPQCHPTNPTTQISVTPISPNLICTEEYAIVIQ